MSDFASAIYGDNPAPSAEHPWVDPATGKLAPGPGTQPAGTSAADAVYSGTPAPNGNPMHDGSVHSGLRGSLQDLVDAGQLEASQALEIGRTITAEAEAAGFTGADADVLLRDLNRPIGDPKAAQVERGEAVRQLRAAYGDRAEATLAAGLRVLRSKAPALSIALARSKAGNSPALTMHVARLGERAMRGGSKR